MESNLIQATEESEQLNESIQENNIQDEFNEIISPSSSKENATSLPEKERLFNNLCIFVLQSTSSD